MSFAKTLFFVCAANLLAATPFTSHAQTTDADVYEKLDVFAHVLERIRAAYVEDITETEVIESAIQGMLQSLDPHSAYLNEDDFKDLTQSTRGEFGGLGIEVTMHEGVVKVVAPIEDTPAHKAGLESGDLIIEIDGEQVQGMKLSDAVDMMRGKPGEPIDLKIFRESEERRFDVEIIRAIIKVKPVKSRLEEGDIAYIRLTTFNENSFKTMQEHLNDLRDEVEGDDIKAMVLDMRNNPGGLLTQAIAIADGFLEEGEIVSTKGRMNHQNARYGARAGDILAGKPIVVLINGGTASASEIVAGALQDHKRGIVVGTKSFGKGSVQTVMRLPGNAGMRLTTARYYTPAGRSIQAEGIVPDVVVEQLKDKEAIDVSEFKGEAGLKGHLNSGQKNNDDNRFLDTEANEKHTAGEALKNEKDYQLQRALDIAKALSLYE